MIAGLLTSDAYFGISSIREGFVILSITEVPHSHFNTSAWCFLMFVWSSMLLGFIRCYRISHVYGIITDDTWLLCETYVLTFHIIICIYEDINKFSINNQRYINCFLHYYLSSIYKNTRFLNNHQLFKH